MQEHCWLAGSSGGSSGPRQGSKLRSSLVVCGQPWSCSSLAVFSGLSSGAFLVNYICMYCAVPCSEALPVCSLRPLQQLFCQLWVGAGGCLLLSACAVLVRVTCICCITHLSISPSGVGTVTCCLLGTFLPPRCNIAQLRVLARPADVFLVALLS